mmetsp:Transcript_122559/g.357897  ORF Transcript_122559/g.357897 Transcript_122559/m.357897 type:complete len:337 (+) Transcript_122559:515-1525(+)
MTPPRPSATMQRRTASSSGPLQSLTASSVLVFSSRRTRLSVSTRRSKASSCSTDAPRRKGTTSAGSPRLSSGSTFVSTSSGSSAAPSSRLMSVPPGARSTGSKRSRSAARRATSSPRTIHSRTRDAAWFTIAPRRSGCDMRASKGTKVPLITDVGSCISGISASRKRSGSTAAMTAMSASGGASSAAASLSAGTALTISTAWRGSRRCNRRARGARTAVVLMIGATTSKKPRRSTPLRSSRKISLAVCCGTSSSNPRTARASACRSSVPVLQGCRSKVQLRSPGYWQVSAKSEQGPNLRGPLPHSRSCSSLSGSHRDTACAITTRRAGRAERQWEC